MFILRSVNKVSGIAHNRILGDSYTLVFKGFDEFEKIKEGGDWESPCEDHNLILAFLSNNNGRIEGLDSYSTYYIMTESGKTFEKV